MKEQKYTLTVTERQLRLIAECVEDCHRFTAGQMLLSNTTSLIERISYRKIMRLKLQRLQPLMTGGMEYTWDGFGCPDDAQRRFIAQTYCIYREIIHRLMEDENRDELCVYKHPTLTCDEGGPLPIIKKVREK